MSELTGNIRYYKYQPLLGRCVMVLQVEEIISRVCPLSDWMDIDDLHYEVKRWRDATEKDCFQLGLDLYNNS